MADEKTYSENEHIAILSDRVAKETADLTAERDQLVSVRSELETKLDVAESAKQAAEQRAADAEKSLEDFKAQIETEREAAARKDERIAKAKETAGHLADDFFEDEKRVARIVAMADEDFEGYLNDLASTSTTTTKTTTTVVPRETAMAGQQVADTGTESVAKGFLLRRYVSQEG
jgi:chromosome segregation ATPase